VAGKWRSVRCRYGRRRYLVADTASHRSRDAAGSVSVGCDARVRRWPARPGTLA